MLQEWDKGWSLEEFMDEATVYGSDGGEIGSVENLLIDDDNRIVALVTEVGGFADIGDTHVAVPWDEIQFSVHAVTVPVEEANIGDYSIFALDPVNLPQLSDTQEVEDDLATGDRLWQATDVLDDYAVVEDKAYGYVDDLIFTNDGVLTAVIINTDIAYGGGPRAFPWNGDPARPVFDLPYEEAEVIELSPFNRDELGGAPSAAASDAAQN